MSSHQAPKASGPYSQTVLAGDFLFVAGQLPVDPDSGKIMTLDIRKQTRQVLDNLEAQLKSAGLTLKNVVRTDVFMKDLNEFSIMNEEYANRFNIGTLPVRQTIQVARLPMDALVEISCIAYRGH